MLGNNAGSRWHPMTDPYVPIVAAMAAAHAVMLLLLAPLRGWKRRGVRRGVRLRVSVIVPCCGDLEGNLGDNLRAIAQQDRRPDRLILVARSDNDKAIPEMRRVQQAYPFVEVVVAGKAERCGQKNHNLLAALRRVGDSDVYVFADSDIRPDERWLDALLEPLESDPCIGVATALCDLPPADAGLAAATQALFTLHQSRFQRLIGVPWGGSTAVRAGLFNAAGVAVEWGRTVLDDWVLWRRVAPLARIVTVPLIDSGARSRARTWSECLGWNIRQFQYFRLYGSLAFHTLLATQVLVAGFLVYLPARALVRGAMRIEAFLPSLNYVGLMTLVNLLLFRCSRGRRICFRQRFIASLLGSPLIAGVTIAAWLRRAMVWHGITYHLDGRGRVRAMEVTSPELQGEPVASATLQSTPEAAAVEFAVREVAPLPSAPTE